ncbi:translocation protein TolB [Desulfovibrio aerotolerans]|uniref:Translocation protein TolB n=1 Tax=Solidesulfovibrio aerotolerans TaxID=295255 RepID=A0A7C9JA72_9BACT|nr:PD40 domain-containing protein [Solidesulfovibrio aerotolerans]MYL84098.1 translocation protein TolB [Solidesulfovibrio aerotolerans]
MTTRKQMLVNGFWSAALAVLMCLLASPAQAQSSLAVDIQGPGQAKMNLVMARPFAGGGQLTPADKLQDLINKDLQFLPFLQLVPPSNVPGQVGGATVDQIDFKPFSLAKVDVLVTANWTPGGNLGNVELRAFEVYSQKVLVGKGYDSVTDAQLPDIADKFCMELMQALTGQGGFFNSQIAFVKPSSGKGTDIWTVRPTGRGLTRVTSYNELGMAVSPSWSFDGRRIVFTLIGSRAHYLGVWSGGGKPQVYTLPSTNVVSPHFLPDGQVAVSLTMQGKADIYLLGAGFQPGRPLTSGGGIKVSPSFDASGHTMAYVSDQTGSPNIYVTSVGGGGGRRVTTSGYNTNPSVSPDGKLVAFTKQLGSAQKVFVLDLGTGQETQVTSGGGSDENPSFSPDGYFIAFSSTRSGGKKIFVTTRHGATPVMIPTGDGSASMPSWGPLPQ